MVSSITEAKQLKAPNVCMLDLSDHPSYDVGKTNMDFYSCYLHNYWRSSNSCGDIHDIHFPFRLKADPLNCGDSENCTCPPDYFNTAIITSIFGRALTPKYHYLKSTSGTITTVEYHDPFVPIIYINCLAPVNSSRYTPFSNSLQSHSYIAIGRDMLISDLAENCSVEMMALASLSQGLSRDNTTYIRAAICRSYILILSLATFFFIKISIPNYLTLGLQNCTPQMIVLCDYGDKICCGILNLDCSSGVAMQKT
ncbi:hypothetical protein R3W88_008940 [Solanum pinnatisectum]|uniref:Uncharacterized protein n=1 Tax=Solanum pinnatisectum TaxID=50273 RepID=A0AAV9M9X6_9SOLN|nr:hypothetical protein R3W88_008940 [Solanum pinnatisectum]